MTHITSTDKLYVISNHKILSTSQNFSLESDLFTMEWEGLDIEFSLSANRKTLRLVWVPDHTQGGQFLKTVVQDVVNFAPRAYDVGNDMVIATEFMAHQNYPSLFNKKTPKI